MNVYVFKILTLVVTLFVVACGDLETSEVTHQGSASQDATPGKDGTAGKDGATGPAGEKGMDGLHVVLVDQNLKEIGYYLERVDFDDNTFEIMTIEGYRTIIDLDDGTFRSPTELASGFGFSCMYESNDCSGECYGAEERARGYILTGQAGTLHYVESDASSTAITSESHNVNTAAGTCVVGTIALTNAVPTQTYEGVLSETLSVPINLQIKN